MKCGKGETECLFFRVILLFILFFSSMYFVIHHLRANLIFGPEIYNLMFVRDKKKKTIVLDTFILMCARRKSPKDFTESKRLQ